MGISEHNRMNQWDKVAPFYDQWMGENGDELHQKIIDPLIFSYLEHIRNATILDAGCGNGYFLKKLSRVSKQVIGVDNSTELLNITQKRIADLDNVSVKQSNLADQIPFHDMSFDVVIASMVVQYLDSLELFVTETYRILKEGGICIVVLDHPAHALADRIRMLDGKPTDKFITLDSYFKTGRRKKRSLGTHVEFEYMHRTISEYLNVFSKYLHLDHTDERTEDGETPRILGFRFEKVQHAT